MNTKDYTYLLNKPYSLNEKQTTELESILTEFPYLQSARAIYLKGLYNKDSFRYNNELKKTAAYTTDRSVLFEFITSEEFRSIDFKVLEQEQKLLAEIPVQEDAVVTPPTTVAPVDKLEESIKLSIIEATDDEKPITAKKGREAVQPEETDTSVKAEEPAVITETPESEAVPVITIPAAPIGSPLKFDQAEKHSFAEWLQLSKIKPIDRKAPVQQDEPVKTEVNEQEKPAGLEEKLSLIDRFIEASPKIHPVKSDNSAWENLSRKTVETPGLMTETLARVYLEQKKYTKAVQAYEILILKYPEKSAFFADRISEVKDLQQNNN